MRNIIEHPLTSEETLEILDALAEKELKSEAIGGMQTYALQAVYSFIENNKSTFDDFLDNL